LVLISLRGPRRQPLEVCQKAQSLLLKVCAQRWWCPGPYVLLVANQAYPWAVTTRQPLGFVSPSLQLASHDPWRHLFSG
jgi:hypothetical protein